MGRNWAKYELTKKRKERLYYWPITRLQFILIRITTIHSEQEITLPNGDWGSNCVICGGHKYPCGTIKIIYK